VSDFDRLLYSPSKSCWRWGISVVDVEVNVDILMTSISRICTAVTGPSDVAGKCSQPPADAKMVAWFPLLDSRHVSSEATVWDEEWSA
jgi:hypothetical protein